MMLDLTGSIEAREEEYLYSMADRFGKAPPETPPSAFVAFLATLLQRCCLIMVVLMVLALGGVYQLQSSQEYHAHVHHNLFVMAYGATSTVVVVNAFGWMAVRFQNDPAMKLFVLLLVLVLISAAAISQQVTAIDASQSRLLEVILRNNATDDAVPDEDKEFVLNGGQSPSLVARVIFDAPGWFLQWMQQQCIDSDSDGSSGDSSSSGTSLALIRINSEAFFDSLWNPNEQSCVLTTLRRNLTVDLMAQVFLGFCIAAACIQGSLFTVMILLEQTSRRRKRSRRMPTQSSQNQSSLTCLYLLRILLLLLALIGGVITHSSADLLQSCNFSHYTEWIFAGILAFGFIVVLSVLFVSCQWKPHVAIVLVLLCLGAEVCGFVLLGQVRVGLSDLSSSQTIQKLRDLYQIVSTQTCSPVQQWLSDVCIADGNTTLASTNSSSKAFDAINETGFDLSCEIEFGTLILESLVFSQHVLLIFLWCDMLLLVMMLLPLLQHIANAFAMCFWRLLVPSSMLPDLSFNTSEGGPVKHKSLLLDNARDLYLETIKSPDEAVRKVETQAFDSYWKAMKGFKPTDNIANEKTEIFEYEFEAIVRLLTIQRLTTKCKLDVSLNLSNDGKTLFLLIHASDNLLMMTLCEMDYKLQFADYIDPGRTFWRNPKEIDMDERILDMANVKQKFKWLLNNSIVSHKEAVTFPLPRVSARIQALLRASRVKDGTLTCNNRHPAYASYHPASSLHFVYKKYPNRLDVPDFFRRSMLLRTVDCIRITQHIIENEFAVDSMKQGGMISSFYWLHGASRFDFNSRDTLSSAWVTFWRPAYHAGEFDPETHWWLNRVCRFYPFRQPLREVRDYFGECIAFYFAWVAFYSELLMAPALGVVIILLLSPNDIDFMPFVALYRSDVEQESSQSPFKSISISASALSLGLGVVVWGFVFAKWWERKTVWFELQWGTTSLGLDVKDRANFHGEKVINPVTQEVEISASSTEQIQKQILSGLCVFGLSCVHLMASIALILLQGYLAQWIGVRWSMLVCCGCLSMVIQWNGAIISSIAHNLSEEENYQNEVSFQNSVIVKIFFMQCVNTYGGLLLLAFTNFAALRHTFFKPLVDPYLRYFESISVIIQMEVLLTLIFVVRIAAHLLTILQRVARKYTTADPPPANPVATAKRTRKANPTPRPISAQEEYELPEYGGAYEDYTEIVVQFGLVVMFSSILPLAPLFAFVESALEMRLDAINLCFFLQRPPPEFAEGIGLWSSCVRILLKMALLANFGFVYFTAANHQDWTFVQRTSSFLMSVLTCLLIAEILWFAVPSTSRYAQEVQARNEFLVERYFGDHENSQSPNSNWNADLKEQETAQTRDPSVSTQVSLEHSNERYELLQRLNVALRTPDTLNEAPALIVEKPLVTENSGDGYYQDDGQSNVECQYDKDNDIECEIAEVDEEEEEKEEEEQVFVYQSARYLRSRQDEEAKQKKSTDEFVPSEAAVLALTVAVDVDNFNVALAQELEQSLPVEVANKALLKTKRALAQRRVSTIRSPDQDHAIHVVEALPVVAKPGDEGSVSDQVEFKAQQSDVSSESSSAPDRRSSKRSSFLSAFKSSKRDGSEVERSSSSRASSFSSSSKLSSSSAMSKLFRRRASRDAMPKQDTAEVDTSDGQLTVALSLPRIAPPAPPVPQVEAPVTSQQTAAVTTSKRYSRMSLTGREAIREAAQRNQFDFTNDGGTWRSQP